MQAEFNKIHCEILNFMMNLDKYTRNEMQLNLFQLLVSYNKLSRAMGIEPDHDTIDRQLNRDLSDHRGNVDIELAFQESITAANNYDRESDKL